MFALDLAFLSSKSTKIVLRQLSQGMSYLMLGHAARGTSAHICPIGQKVSEVSPGFSLWLQKDQNAIALPVLNPSISKHPDNNTIIINDSLGLSRTHLANLTVNGIALGP